MLSASIVCTVSELWIYPVKSCAGVRLDAAELTAQGLAHDRAWMVVDAQGDMLTQREWPQMALIHPELDTACLRLHAPGLDALTVPLPPSTPTAQVSVQVWDDTVPAWDEGAEASHWLSGYLQQSAPALAATLALPLRLVRFDERHRRTSSERWTRGHTALNRFSDGFPLLVLSQASLDGLNQRLQQAGEATVDVRRFRPNLVLSGTELSAHDEDRLAALHIETAAQAEAVLLPVKPCPRCPIPDIDPDAAHSQPTVTQALQAYRADARVGGALSFGMNALVLSGCGQSLRVGQRVRADWAFDD